MSRIQVNRKQAKNEVLKKLTRVAWEFADIEPDYVVGRTACVLFLSLRYHALYPNYIFERINKLGQNYELRILLVVVDHIEHQSYLKEMSKLCIRCNFTLMLSWSIEDAAMYLEKYKLFEGKPADAIMEKNINYDNQTAYDQYLIDALAETKSINRTDASSLVSMFDRFERLVMASSDELSLCPGVGMKKARNLYEFLHRNIKRSAPGELVNASSQEREKEKSLDTQPASTINPQ